MDEDSAAPVMGATSPSSRIALLPMPFRGCDDIRRSGVERFRRLQRG
jgi:hypothetical protein